jgi:phosphatidylinositol alpha-1,6-mannosyltransferase
MKILVIAQVFPPQPGGSGRWLWELYRRFRADSVHVVADTYQGAAAFDARSGISTTRIPLRFPDWGLLHPRGAWHYAWALARLNAVVSRSRPSVLHCGKALPEGLLAAAVARLHGVPFWCYVHGEELTLARTSGELSRLTAHVLRRAQRLVANSHFTQAILVDDWRVPPSKITVMHPGVDTVKFAPAARDEAVRQRLGWSGRTVLLTVGALQKRKGQDTVIRALREIRGACPDVLYAVAGEGWEQEYLESLTRECGVEGAVQFRGVPNDLEIVECYQQCDLFVLANRRVGWDVEGFGMVLLEAQACGRPVAAGRSGGTADTLRDGVTGQLVDCEHSEALGNALVRLLRDEPLRIRMGEQARAWTVEQYDWNRQVAEATRLFADTTSASG